ncbi:MAG: undecaprenyldiphospho-muramoylpentapeptide beta-N-acetylglucosaminyltransferase [Chthonomonas sp.]|nr:undecaprenyldiphospho-muramoylpentapeptide beta-N-acetylglucosaminyltransferase [Chthonomonas sp.]
MRAIVTGGGTGGHIYPALEIAAGLQSEGLEVAYFGSFRGQEGRACQRIALPFQAFPSEPLYSLKTPRGWRAAFHLAKAVRLAKTAMREFGPKLVVSTGGYSSAPVLYAARSLGIPYVIHEQNVVPGRTNRLLSPQSFAVCTTFRRGAEHFPQAQVIRTGIPVRKSFRGQPNLNFEHPVSNDRPVILAMGGSQGASAINEAVLATVVRMARYHTQWIHLSGPDHFDAIQKTAGKLGVGDDYKVRAYLSEDEMATAVFASSLALCRSGAGTLAELAAYRKPSILVPLPNSFANHQMLNAQEFAEMGAATIIPQHELQPSTVESRILQWDEPEMREQAAAALAEWDNPNALADILQICRDAMK